MALILKRNATRDYLDFAALAENLGPDPTAEALSRFDQLYPQPNGASALRQLEIQLAQALPFDLDAVNLAEYKQLAPRWHDWYVERAACADCAVQLFDRLAGAPREKPATSDPQ